MKSYRGVLASLICCALVSVMSVQACQVPTGTEGGCTVDCGPKPECVPNVFQCTLGIDECLLVNGDAVFDGDQVWVDNNLNVKGDVCIEGKLSVCEIDKPEVGEIVFTSQDIYPLFDTSCRPGCNGVTARTPEDEMDWMEETLKQAVAATKACNDDPQGKVMVPLRVAFNLYRLCPQVLTGYPMCLPDDCCKPQRPAVDFCVPADLDVTSDECVEIDVHFLTAFEGDPCEKGDVAINALVESRPCGEAVGRGTQAVGVKELTVCSSARSCELNHYVVTLRYPAAGLGGNGALAPRNWVRLMLERELASSGDDYEPPVFVNTICVRYPKRVVSLPMSDLDCGDCECLLPTCTPCN